MQNTGNPFTNIFEDLPDLGFFTRLGQQTQQGSPQRRFIQNRFSPLFNEFKGQIGQQLAQGATPTVDDAESRFFDFLGNDFFDQRFRRLAPTQRGQTQARFNAPTRFFL
jgi:hypothetical protein